MLFYSPHTTSWSPQGMRVLWQCTVPRAEVMFVTTTWKHSPLKERNKKGMNMTDVAVRLWITTSPYRWPVGSLPSTCMLCTPPPCTKDVYTSQGSTRDPWTVLIGAGVPRPSVNLLGDMCYNGNRKFENICSTKSLYLLSSISRKCKYIIILYSNE
jgi:hypothetical protein